jgi:methylmalonyl-CoA/ethylmalonyl-CoA epimerase
MKINHIGIVVKNIENSIKYYENYFSYKLVVPVCIDPIQKVRVAMLNPTDQNFNFELLEPITDDSPITSALRKGGGLNHVCYEVLNIEEAIVDLKKKGSKLISGPVPGVVFNEKNVVFMYTEMHEIIELVEI